MNGRRYFTVTAHYTPIGAGSTSLGGHLGPPMGAGWRGKIRLFELGVNSLLPIALRRFYPDWSFGTATEVQSDVI